MAIDLTIIADAQEFGKHYRQGGWRLGLLAARSVRLGNEKPLGLKATTAEFAKQAGVTVETI